MNETRYFAITILRYIKRAFYDNLLFRHREVLQGLSMYPLDRPPAVPDSISDIVPRREPSPHLRVRVPRLLITAFFPRERLHLRCEG